MSRRNVTSKLGWSREDHDKEDAVWEQAEEATKEIVTDEGAARLHEADQWMRANEGILPGPLSDADWVQIRDLLAKYASSFNAALQFEFDDLFKQFNVIAAMARRYLVEIGELRDSRDRLQEALRVASRGLLDAMASTKAKEILRQVIRVQELIEAALGDPEKE